MAKISPLDIVKRTPKTNCGECGRPSCLAFGAAVATQGQDPRQCPYIEAQGLELPAKEEVAGTSQERDLQLVEYLKSKIAPLDFSEVAPLLGTELSEKNTDALIFRYLGWNAVLKKTGVLLDGIGPEDPRDQILIYNYLHYGGGPPPDNDWIGMESMPNSISKVKTLETYSEKPLAELFDTADAGEITKICIQFDGQLAKDHSADLGMIIPVLPRVKLYILFWKAEPEDGFDAKVKILFDKNVLEFLDIESLVFSAERLAERFQEMASSS